MNNGVTMSQEQRPAAQQRWFGAAQIIGLVRAEPGITRAVAAQRLGIGSGGAADLVARLRRVRLLDETPAPATGRGGVPRVPVATGGRWYSRLNCVRGTGVWRSPASMADRTWWRRRATMARTEAPAVGDQRGDRGGAVERAGPDQGRIGFRGRHGERRTPGAVHHPRLDGCRSVGVDGGSARRPTCHCCSATTPRSPVSPKPAARRGRAPPAPARRGGTWRNAGGQRRAGDRRSRGSGRARSRPFGTGAWSARAGARLLGPLPSTAGHWRATSPNRRPTIRWRTRRGPESPRR